MGRVKALFDYAKGYKGYKDALKRSQNKEIRGMNALQNVALLNMVAQYQEQYGAMKDYYDTMKAVAEGYEASDDPTLQEQAKSIFEKDLPLAMDEMLRYRDMLKEVERQQKDREEASYFDIDDIGDDEAMESLDEAEEKLRSKNLSSDEKSFWERKREEILAERESFINSVNEHRESFDDNYNKCKNSISSMDDSTKSIKDIRKEIKNIDINDPDAMKKLAELKAQLNTQQETFDSHLTDFKNDYGTMVRDHNEFIDTAGFSPFKKIKNTSLDNMKTFAEMNAETDMSYDDVEMESDGSSKAPLSDRFRASYMKITDRAKDWVKNRNKTVDYTDDFDEDFEETDEPDFEEDFDDDFESEERAGIDFEGKDDRIFATDKEVENDKPLGSELGRMGAPASKSDTEDFRETLRKMNENSEPYNEIDRIREEREAKFGQPVESKKSNIAEEERAKIEKVENVLRGMNTTKEKSEDTPAISQSPAIPSFLRRTNEEAKKLTPKARKGSQTPTAKTETKEADKEPAVGFKLGPVEVSAEELSIAGKVISSDKEDSQIEAAMDATIIKSKDAPVAEAEKSEPVKAEPAKEVDPELALIGDAPEPTASVTEKGPELKSAEEKRAERVAQAEAKFGDSTPVIENSGVGFDKG